MKGFESFSLGFLDYAAFVGYFAILSLIGYIAGRREKSRSDEFFLAGRSLPWYVVGCSFIASNISSEHFIGMIGAAFIFGIAPAMFEWGNVLTFSILIWFFIPFLVASRVFTTPEFMERRFNLVLRQFFAVITVITNVVAFLAAVLYGGGLALQALFGWNLWLAIGLVAVAAGIWVIYGGLVSAAWADVFTVIIMISGGLMVTLLGLYGLSGDSHSLIDGFQVMIERNQGRDGLAAEFIARGAPYIAHTEHYNRLSVIQPTTHVLTPWTGLLTIIFSVSIWYNVINQFMIQRVLGAKDMYHARMGIVLAGYMKVILPAIVVLPGMILFAHIGEFPEIVKLPWADVKPEADKGYVHLLQTLVPIGLRGLFLAALFGAIQSTVQAVLNSTATIFTLDIYKRLLRREASERHLVAIGRISTVAVLIIALLLARMIPLLGKGLFEYIQELYAFFAPPFGAIFLLGILFRRINGTGATAAAVLGFALAIAIKVFIYLAPGRAPWIEPFMNQAAINWAFSVVVCVVVSLLTAPPAPERVTDELTFNWRKLNIGSQLGTRWYNHVVLWWGLFFIMITGLIVLFSGQWL